MSPLQQHSQNNDNSTNTTIWMGNVAAGMDEKLIQALWLSLDFNVVVKLMQDESSSSGYAFLDFGSNLAARCALRQYKEMGFSNIFTFQLSWASGGGIFEKRENKRPEYSLFLGDLPTLSEKELLDLFQAKYPSCMSVNIMTDSETGKSRKYGFARFRKESDQLKALEGMHGCVIGNKPIRVSIATPKASCTTTTTTTSPLSQQLTQEAPEANVNTTVFVGALATSVQETELRQCFDKYGEIVYATIKGSDKNWRNTAIKADKNYGFVQFVTRRSAELAIKGLDGHQLGLSRIRLSWAMTNEQQEKASLLKSNQASPRMQETRLPSFRSTSPSQTTQASPLLERIQLPSFLAKKPSQTSFQQKQQTSWNPFDDDFDTSFACLQQCRQQPSPLNSISSISSISSSNSTSSISSINSISRKSIWAPSHPFNVKPLYEQAIW